MPLLSTREQRTQAQCATEGQELRRRVALGSGRIMGEQPLKQIGIPKVSDSIRQLDVRARPRQARLAQEDRDPIGLPRQ